MITSILLFTLSAIGYSIKELYSSNKLKWIGKHTSFWGNNSWMRKYNFKGDMYNDLPPDNWYYKFFKIDYRERFPGSATIFVFITDGFHLMQFFFKLLFCSAFYPLTNWWFPVLIWLLWTIVWNLCDKYLTK